jgi:hypothetical protein
VWAIAADTGRNYMSKFFADEWLAANGLLWNAPQALSIADLVKSRGSRRLVTIDLNATAAEAIELLQATGISQLPVVQDGKPVGSQGIARDISQRKRLERGLRQVQTMEAIGRLAHGVARDFSRCSPLSPGTARLIDRLAPHDPSRAHAIRFTPPVSCDRPDEPTPGVQSTAAARQCRPQRVGRAPNREAPPHRWRRSSP